MVPLHQHKKKLLLHLMSSLCYTHFAKSGVKSEGWGCLKASKEPDIKIKQKPSPRNPVCNQCPVFLQPD